MKLFKTILTVLLICFMSFPCSSTNRDDDPHQLFIDFLKQEVLYHKDAVYYPFPFEDITTNSKVPWIETNPERIKQLICDEIIYIKSDSSAFYRSAPALTHRIKIQALNKDRFKAEAFVTLPNSSTTLSLGSANIGIPQSFDMLEVTLMRIEDNIAYLLIEDKSKLIDYSYTRPDYICSEQEEEEEEEEKNAWKKRELDSPYIRETDIYRQGRINDISSYANDGFKHITRSRITGIAYNAEGKKLQFETLSEDFRHYLWYRNMDMPYSSMIEDYKALQKRFHAPEGDCRYHQLNVVRLEASGHITSLDVNILSRSTQSPLYLQLEESFNPRNHYAEKPSLEEMTYRISAIKNMHPDSIASHLTITPYTKSPRRSKLKITAFLPACYNTQYGGADIWFTRLTFPYETDSITLESNDIRTENFDADYLYQSIYGSAVTLTEIPLSNRNDGILTGEVECYYPHFEAARYDLSDLPEGLRYENDTLIFNKKKAHTEDEYNTYHSFIYSASDFDFPPSSVIAYDEAGEELPFEEKYGANDYKMIFKRPVKAIIKLWKKDISRVKIPFSINLPAPQNK